ncbi:SRPBCC family protein [Terrabacter sp. BE26]|uniref:SRPBCC family protein n=1 Tax=Terrabacter sp. BE26 TaxID=2898152 RepID=UPI0035BE99D9
MTTRVEKTVLVNVPVSRAYNQWTQFEEFPRFMGGVRSVEQLGDDRLRWVAEIAGVRREWQARILEQVPDLKITWAATEGATNAGVVTFEDLGGGQTSVTLVLEYEPEGLVEKVGDKAGIVQNQAQNDLERFKQFVESEGYATGGSRDSGDSGDSTSGVTAGTVGASQPAGGQTGATREGAGQAGADAEWALGTGAGDDIRMLTHEEIEADPSDVPLGADEDESPGDAHIGW